VGKKSTKTTSTSTPWTPAQPLLLGAGQGITDTVNNNQGNLNNVESGITGSTIPGIQQQIGDQRQQLQPGYNYLNSTLGSNYLQTGQAQAQALGDYAGQQAGNSINSAFSQAGRTGSGNHATDLARGVTQAELAPMLQNLQFNQGVQGQAAGMLPGYGTSQFAGYTPLLGAQQLAGQLPYYGANALGNIGGLYNGYGTQTGTQPGGWLGGLMNSAAQGASMAAMMSDRRLKTKIEKVGEAKDGLGIYTWKWRSDPDGPTVKGVLADEVEKLRPWAFVKGFVNGIYDGVDYGTLGSVA
jgi:hypothetical protein